jgi:hypothetical protein
MKLNEITGMLREMDVYHGSDHSFDKFDADKIGDASGQDKGGWGFYFTTSEEVASQYISGRGEVRAFRIPSGPYFDFDEGFGPSFAQRIYDELEEAGVSEDELDDYRDEMMDEQYVYETTYDQVYRYLAHVLGSSKKVSLFLGNMGYVGNSYSDRTNPDVTNYVVFDSNDIQFK